jgi:hypothetical protein
MLYVESNQSIESSESISRAKRKNQIDASCDGNGMLLY